MRLEAGLCSVTFRGLETAAVVELAASAGLRSIEWGGDVHVPAGDLAAAARAGDATREAGLRVASYGSYLFADAAVAHGLPAVLDTTEALGAPLLRVWAPLGIEPDSSPQDRRTVVEALHRVCEAAEGRGIGVYLEFHGGTLTSSAASALELVESVGAANLLCAWQPPYWAPQPLAGDLADLDGLAGHLAHVHVYSWLPDGTRRVLAAEGDLWPERLVAAERAPGIRVPRASSPERAALIEFVPGDDPALLAVEAETLLGWLGSAPQGPAATTPNGGRP